MILADGSFREDVWFRFPATREERQADLLILFRWESGFQTRRLSLLTVPSRQTC